MSLGLGVASGFSMASLLLLVLPLAVDVGLNGPRAGRGRRRRQRVLSPYADEFLRDEGPFPSFSQQRHGTRPFLSGGIEAGASGDEAAVAMEELLLLERLRAAGVDGGLRAHLEKALQEQVHHLGSSSGAFVGEFSGRPLFYSFGC